MTSRARLAVAAAAARLAGAFSRRLGRGGGTALPGVVAEVLASDFVAAGAAQLAHGALVVTGTNGKTTTAALLAAMLRRSGVEVLHNTSGSNLTRGLAAALASHTDWHGRLRVSGRTAGLFEVDEAAFARAAPAVRPRVVVITNLFRDQLDRYGEVDTVAALWRETLRRLNPPPVLVLNADDPGVAALGRGYDGPVVYFGIDDARWAHPGLEHAADAKSCPECGRPLTYPACFFGHLGHYACPAVHIERPRPAVAAVRIERESFETAAIDVRIGGEASGDEPGDAGTQGRRDAGTGLPASLRPCVPASLVSCLLHLRLSLPGLYNVYNALAAAAGALAQGVSPDAIAGAVGDFHAAFGRAECVDVQGRRIYLLLAKNPVGMNEVLRTVFHDAEPKHALFALNDLAADSTDVSWIWDADFELAAGRVKTLVISGRRAEDLEVRLKYAGVVDSPATGPVPYVVISKLAEALDQAIAMTPPGGTLYVVPTYTAMLELRQVLAARGHLRPFWQT